MTSRSGEDEVVSSAGAERASNACAILSNVPSKTDSHRTVRRPAQRLRSSAPSYGLWTHTAGRSCYDGSADEERSSLFLLSHLTSTAQP